MQLRLPRADASDKDTLPAQIYGKSKNATTPYVRTQHLFPDCVGAIHIQFDLSPCAYLSSTFTMPEINMCNLCALVTSGSGAIGRIIAESLAAFAATVDTT